MNGKTLTSLLSLFLGVTAYASVPRQGTVRFVPTVLVSGAAENLLSGSDWREPLKKFAPTCTASVGTGGPSDPAAVARRMVVEKKSFAYWETVVRGVKAGRTYLGGTWAKFKTANLCLWWQGRPVGYKADEFYRIYSFSGFNASLERYLTAATKDRLAGDPNEWRLFYRTFKFSAPLTDEACEVQYGFYDGAGDMTFAEPFLIDVTEAPRTMELEMKDVKPFRMLQVICLDLRDPMWTKEFDAPVTEFKMTLPETVDAFRNADGGGVPGNMLIVKYVDGTEEHYASPAEGVMFAR